MIGSLTSAGSSFHLGGKGLSLFILRFGVRQVGMGQRSRLWIKHVTVEISNYPRSGTVIMSVEKHVTVEILDYPMDGTAIVSVEKTCYC